MSSGQSDMLKILLASKGKFKPTKDNIGVTNKAFDNAKLKEATEHADWPTYLEYGFILQQVSAKKLKEGGSKIETSNSQEVVTMHSWMQRFENARFPGMKNPRGAIFSKMISILWVEIGAAFTDQGLVLYNNIPALKAFNSSIDHVIFLRMKNARLTDAQARSFITVFTTVSNWDTVPKLVRDFIDQRMLRAFACIELLPIKFVATLAAMNAWAIRVRQNATKSVQNDAIDKILNKSNITWPPRGKDFDSNSNSNAL